MPRVKLKNKVILAEGTAGFYFERSSGFQFEAGQFGDWTLIDPPETDQEGNTRSFTIASAPAERDLMIATRMRDTAFKRVLNSTVPGTEVELDGPFGQMVLHDHPGRPAVFLAGGIGITPFRSIAIQAARGAQPQQMYLFYSNRRPEDAAFLDELVLLGKQNPKFKLIATMTDMAHSSRTWNGETGFIDGVMLSRYLPDIVAPLYYIAGPPQMVAAMRKTLNQAGVKSQDVRFEDFVGY
ncbi:MAG TPA: FAD-dependent oxidoreductase [Terriglobia bacterium]|nr:FAD-dependent oxidoreductase [Terriglobia bacterium]